MPKNTEKPHVNPTLVDTVVHQLKNRPVVLTLKSLSSTCDCSTTWLSRLISGDIKNPGALQIERLYNALNPNAPLKY